MGFRVKVKLYDKLLSIFLIFIGQEGSSVSNSTLTHTLTHTHTHTHTLTLPPSSPTETASGGKPGGRGWIQLILTCPVVWASLLPFPSLIFPSSIRSSHFRTSLVAKTALLTQGACVRPLVRETSLLSS